ncbi:MAG: hypothetical protein ACRDZO_06255 [Egibacteraceae bacterium]
MDEPTPLGPRDPRFAEGDPDDPGKAVPRSLVRSLGPGPSPLSRQVRVLRIAFPLLFLAGVLTVAAVFIRALDQGPPQVRLGPVDAVRAAVEARPRRVCIQEGASPCAWITFVAGELAAFNTNGPLPVEYGRLGVGWCPSSGGFGANATGSRWDAAGNVVEGPAPRGLDRFDVIVSRDGIATVDFSNITGGLLSWQVDERIPPQGPDCPSIPFDRDPDLPLVRRRLA